MGLARAASLSVVFMLGCGSTVAVTGEGEGEPPDPGRCALSMVACEARFSPVEVTGDIKSFGGEPRLAWTGSDLLVAYDEITLFAALAKVTGSGQFAWRHDLGPPRLWCMRLRAACRVVV